MAHRHRVGTNKIRTDPPIVAVHINFFFCGNMSVVFVCKSVHLKDDFFSATQFDHGLSESCITDEPIVNAQEFSFLAFLLELIRRCDILDRLLSFRTCDRVVGPS